MRKIVLLTSLFFLFSISSFAETVTLKSGGELTATILGRAQDNSGLIVGIKVKYAEDRIQEMIFEIPYDIINETEVHKWKYENTVPIYNGAKKITHRAEIKGATTSIISLEWEAWYGTPEVKDYLENWGRLNGQISQNLGQVIATLKELRIKHNRSKDQEVMVGSREILNQKIEQIKKLEPPEELKEHQQLFLQSLEYKIAHFCSENFSGIDKFEELARQRKGLEMDAVWMRQLIAIYQKHKAPPALLQRSMRALQQWENILKETEQSWLKETT